MKTMSCRQLGGGCDIEFIGSSFEEIEQQSKSHGMEMYRIQDPDHLDAMKNMQLLMSNPDKLTAWIASKRQQFASLPEH